MILHIVRNPVTHDSRVLKETNSLATSGIIGHLEIAGFHEQGYSEWEDISGRTIRRIRLGTRPLPKDLVSQFVKYAEWYARLVGHYRSAPLRIIHCHDLGPLPIAARLKQLTGAKLVYDAHELETETVGSSGVRKALARYAEQWFIRHVDAMITVSPSIRNWYRQRFPNVPIALVRNIPDMPGTYPAPELLRERLNVPEEAVLFIYLGGLTRGRGIEIALEAFSDDQVPHHVLFMGNGPLRSEIGAARNRCPRIHYLPPVPPDQVLAHAAGADAGLCLYEDTCLNHRYCLPNKLFESLLAGIPVLASDLPDQASVVNSHNGGWVVPNDPAAIADILCRLTPGEVGKLRHGLFGRVQELRWEQEAKQLLGLYRNLLSNKAGNHEQ